MPIQQNRQSDQLPRKTHRKSIRRRLLISVLVGCTIPFLLGLFYVVNQTENWQYKKHLERATQMLHQMTIHVDESILINMQQVTEMIASDERILHHSSDITTYVDLNPEVLTSVKSEAEQEISAYFKSIAEAHDVIAFVSYGTEDGGYVEYPPFQPSASYDPRERGWYKTALTKDGPHISEPYQTKVSKELVISVGNRVVKDGKTLGVISLTIRLESIMKNISDTNIGETGQIWIISPNNAIINSPSHPEWFLKPISELGIDALVTAKQHIGTSVTGTLDGVEKVFISHQSEQNGWTYVSLVDKNEILAQTRTMTRILVFILVIVLLTILLLLLIIAQRITKPIQGLTSLIHRMALFDFDEYEQNDLRSYMHHQDEIGEISVALDSLQTNFLELKSSMDSMVSQIRNIHVGDTAVGRIKISDENPFIGIVDSVNVLLDKVSDSMETIQMNSRELSDTNERLTASEEELTSQLEEINQQKDRIHFLAEHDPLTNLPNRRNFHLMLEKALSDGRRGAVILLDMDNFKSVNDTLGHIFGDHILCRIGERLSAAMVSNTFVSRFGGDEFLVLFQVEENSMLLEVFVQSLFQAFTAPVSVDGIDIRVEFSMGIAMFPDDSYQIEQLLMYADMALYQVKKTGKQGFTFFTRELAENVRQKNVIKRILQEAIEQDGFKMVYQPLVRLSDGAIVGYEALLRLKERNISPAVLVKVAEEDGMIITIGRMITRIVVEQMAEWHALGLISKPVAINFSALQINDTAYRDYLLWLLDKNGIKPEFIRLEITESVFLESKATAIAFLKDMRAEGIQIALDDFGAEYSSLSYLTSLPIDTVKFDRELNLRLLGHEGDAMDKLIAFVHSLGKDVVAEGIEELPHVLRLVRGGCDNIQGYVFSKPLEASEIVGIDRKIFEVPLA